MSLQLVLRSLNCGRATTSLFRPLPSFNALKNGPASTAMATSAKEEMDTYWRKNLDLKRPVSPHLQIYEAQLTSGLSILHRITGVGLALGITGFSALMLFSSSPFAVHFQNIKCLGLPPWFIYSCKFIIAWPMTYHSVNGVRHLTWDRQKMLKLDEVYKTGYAMVVTSFILALVLTFL